MNPHEQEVTQVLQTLRPAMEADGGGVELVSVLDGVVTLRFKGACLLCPSQSLTLNLGIAQTLKQQLSWITVVKQTT